MEDILDLKDKKILFELEQDSRQSLSQLSKKIGLKKETIFHRIKNLEKIGIIKAYITEIDAYKLGYKYYPVLLKFQNTTPSIEKRIFDYLKKDRFVAWLTKCEGNWDINLTLIAKDDLELKEFMGKFLTEYSSYISDKQIFITTAVNYFKRGFGLNRRTEQTVTTGVKERINIEEPDLKLLNILSNGARRPLIDIADQLKTTPKNIAYRIKKLKKEKVIQGSRILVDFSKINYKFYKIWFSLQNQDEEKYKKILSYFQQNPNILWATKMIGYYDLSIEMEVRNVEEFRKTIEEIKEKFSNLIKKHESLLIFEEAVLNYLP